MARINEFFSATLEQQTRLKRHREPANAAEKPAPSASKRTPAGPHPSQSGWSFGSSPADRTISTWSFSTAPPEAFSSPASQELPPLLPPPSDSSLFLPSSDVPAYSSVSMPSDPGLFPPLALPLDDDLPTDENPRPLFPPTVQTNAASPFALSFPTSSSPSVSPSLATQPSLPPFRAEMHAGVGTEAKESPTSDEAEGSPEKRDFEVEGDPVLSQRLSKAKRRRQLLWRITWITLLFGVLGGGSAGLWVWHVCRDLPDLRSLQNYRPWRITRILSRDGTIAEEIAQERRTPIPYNEMPKHLIQAVVAAEDADFFKHKGLDYPGIMRAAIKNTFRRRGRPKQGGSTITQQVVKTFLLSSKQVYSRKIREAVLARQLEQHLKKEEILFLYLNQICFGNARFGVEEASLFYFGKKAHALTLTEAAILAGIPKNPERYNPAHSLQDTKLRRDYVLRMMRRQRMLDEKTFLAALKEPIRSVPLQKQPSLENASYTEEARLQALALLKNDLRAKDPSLSEAEIREKADLSLLRDGFSLETSLDPESQRFALHALRDGLRSLEERSGYRGPLRRLPASSIDAHERLLRKTNLLLPSGQPHEGIVLALRSEGPEISVGWKRILLSWNELSWALRRSTWDGKAFQKKTLDRETFLAVGDIVQILPPVSELPAAIPLGSAALSYAGTGFWTLPSSPTTSEPPPPPTLGNAWRLTQELHTEGAVIVLELATRRLLALVGGAALQNRKGDRTTLRRPPAETFLPVIYAQAIASHQYTAASSVMDAYYSAYVQGKRWIPETPSGEWLNRPVPLRTALTRSLSSVAARLVDRLTPQAVVGMARTLGIQAPLPLETTLAIGASPVHLLELTKAYAILASQGIADQPILLEKLEAPGRNLYQRLPNPQRILPAGVAYILTELLQDSAQAALKEIKQTFTHPLAGKAGTSEHSRDAWFLGCTPRLCVGVWLGRDDQAPLGEKERGETTALPIALSILRHLYAQAAPETFPVPEDIFFARINPASGEIAPSGSSDFRFEAFLPKTVPSPNDTLLPEDLPRE